MKIGCERTMNYENDTRIVIVNKLCIFLPLAGSNNDAKGTALRRNHCNTVVNIHSRIVMGEP